MYPVQELDFVSQFVYQLKLDIPAVHQACYLIEVWLLSVFQSYKIYLGKCFRGKIGYTWVFTQAYECFRGALAVLNAV